MDRFCFRPHQVYLLTTLSLAGLLASCGGGGGGSDSSGFNSDTGLQGTISIEAGSRVDRDYADLWYVNDESWPGNMDAPVSVPIQATVGGYLSSAAGTYTDGFPFPEDTKDIYTVALKNGDRYFLQCFPAGGSSVSDLSVSIRPSSGSGITGSACGSSGTVSGDVNSLAITTMAGGPFRYVLSVVPLGALASANVGWPEPGLRVDEAVMTGPAVAASTLSSSGTRASSAMGSMRAIGPDLWHVKRSSAIRTLSASTSTSSDPRAETIAWIRSLREDYGMDVEPNYLFRLQSSSPTTNPGFVDPEYWNLDQINMTSAWSQAGSPTGLGVGIAVMDTGLFSTNLSTYGDWHEDLAANVVAEGGTLDFVSSAYDVDGSSPARDSNPATPLTPGNAAGTSFHGTHVAGIIAAVDNDLGTLGIAHKATILPYRVLGVDTVNGEDGVGSVADLIDAITDAADRSDVAVINLSLGGLPPLTVLQAATDYAWSEGKLVVAAGGNSGDASAVYPAANRRVLGVGATESSGGLADYSNYGRSVDLLAPGGSLDEGIFNAYGDPDGTLMSNYAYVAGTSMAAPHVTGVFALMKDVAGITPDQFRAQLLAGNLTDSAGYDSVLHGAGLLNAEKALDPGTRGDFPTVVSAWPRVVELSSDGSKKRVDLEVLKASAEAAPRVSGVPVTPSPFELRNADGTNLQNGALLEGSLRIWADAASVPDGRPLSGDIEIEYTSNAGNRTLSIPVYVQANDDEQERNAGRHYVLLVDANDIDSGNSKVVVASYSRGQYRYEFDDIEPGNYFLVAGTDLDNNGYICESGEACAEYPEAGSRREITVRDDHALRLDMTTSFRRPSIAEMGLPRYGFKGYPVPRSAAGGSATSKQVQ